MGQFFWMQQNKYMLPAFPVENLVDPTGAGDSFAGGIAGFLATANEIGIKKSKKPCYMEL